MHRSRTQRVHQSLHSYRTGVRLQLTAFWRQTHYKQNRIPVGKASSRELWPQRLKPQEKLVNSWGKIAPVPGM